MESLNVDGLPVWLQVVIGVCTVLGAIVVGIRAIPPLWHAVEQLVAAVHLISTLPEHLDTQDRNIAAVKKKVEEIHHETHNNNGSSIKDSVDRIEAAQAVTATKVSRLVRSQAAFRTETKKRLDELEQAKG